MNLGNLTSVFNRFFLIGFFLPPFFALVLLWQTLSGPFPPNRLEWNEGVDVAVLAAAALAVGLLLTASRRQFHDLLEGYVGPYLQIVFGRIVWPPLSKLQERRRRGLDERITKAEGRVKKAQPAAQKQLDFDSERQDVDRSPGLQRISIRRVDPQRKAGVLRRRLRDRLRRPLSWWRRELTSPEDALHAAMSELSGLRRDRDRYFPVSELRPTRFGNAVRASQAYSFTRWNLDHHAIAAHLDGLLTEAEREDRLDDETDLAFFVNAMLCAAVVLVISACDQAIYRRDFWALLLLVPLFGAFFLYRAAVGAAARLGNRLRASVDLHRFELYERFGLIRPITRSDEEAVGAALSALVLAGTPIPQRLRRHTA